MLKDSLYTIDKLTEKNNMLEAVVSLDKTHPIFKGHFPGQPVLPGVCMMQMVREILETFFSEKLQLQKADDIRYAAMVDPTKDEQLTLQIGFNKLNDLMETKTIILKTDEVICCKMRATFRTFLNQ